VRAYLAVPVIARDGEVLGGLFFGHEQRGVFDEESERLVVAMATLAALAIENARLDEAAQRELEASRRAYAERDQVARVLQESLLPPELPRIPGIEVAARYVPAGEGIDVGGDFYDLFDLGGGAWSVIMGDVCGKGPDAAALTALARYTLRATADQSPLPSEALRLLNAAVLRQRNDGRFITVAYVRIAPDGSGGIRATLSTGGHPQPILLRADGRAEPIGAPGTLLGVVPDPVLSDQAIDLRPGDTLFLYTDGVTEAHAPDRIMDAGDIARLLEDCGGDAAELVTCVEDAVRALGPGPPGDDIAMLALRVAR
jgi:serine phosphatase RsbU (regulator of sigma subunit)